MISETSLAGLRKEVGATLSEKRFLHTLGVERAAVDIGRHCLPDRLTELSAAAILHDAAKELPREEQLGFMRGSDVAFTDEDFASETLYHAFCAPAFIKERFPEFATDEIISAVFLHTSGGEAMSVFDEIIFLADFVEDGREYNACKTIREDLFSALDGETDIDKKIKILHFQVLRVIDFTVNYLQKRERPVNSRMLLARNSIIEKIIAEL